MNHEETERWKKQKRALLTGRAVLTDAELEAREEEILAQVNKAARIKRSHKAVIEESSKQH